MKKEKMLACLKYYLETSTVITLTIILVLAIIVPIMSATKIMVPINGIQEVFSLLLKTIGMGFFFGGTWTYSNFSDEYKKELEKNNTINCNKQYDDNDLSKNIEKSVDSKIIEEKTSDLEKETMSREKCIVELNNMRSILTENNIDDNTIQKTKK